MELVSQWRKLNNVLLKWNQCWKGYCNSDEDVFRCVTKVENYSNWLTFVSTSGISVDIVTTQYLLVYSSIWSLWWRSRKMNDLFLTRGILPKWCDTSEALRRKDLEGSYGQNFILIWTFELVRRNKNDKHPEDGNR